MGRNKALPRVRIVEHTGWHVDSNGKASFVLPDRVIAEAGAEEMRLRNADAQTIFRQTGTLEEWRENVGKLADGNDNLILAMCIMLAGPLHTILPLETSAVHLFGDSSDGKSTIARVAASVWGAPVIGSGGFAASWNSTKNALEVTLAARSDIGLILDEISQSDPDQAQAVAYLLGNNTGRARMKRDATLRPTSSWRLAALSTGEPSYAQYVSVRGRQATQAGQAVRFADVPVNMGAGFGGFQNLHGSTSGGDFARRLYAACLGAHGHAGPAFVEKLVNLVDEGGDGESKLTGAESLKAAWPSFLAKGLEKFLPGEHAKAAALNKGQVEESRQAKRMATHFLGYAFAGTAAANWNILPISREAVLWAVKSGFDRWVAHRGGTGNHEDAQLVENTEYLCFTHRERFVDATSEPAEGEKRLPIRDRLGFRRDVPDEDGVGTAYFIPPEIFKSELFCGAHSVRQLERALGNAGLLQRQGGTYRIQPYPDLPDGWGRKRCYKILIPSSEKPSGEGGGAA
jgi:putative DNA primase/helicase